MALENLTYEATECPPELKAGRIGGAFGGTASKEVNQQCVKVQATITNPNKSVLNDVAVFGFVLDDQVFQWAFTSWENLLPSFLPGPEVKRFCFLLTKSAKRRGGR
jgi:hypothetical protein